MSDLPAVAKADVSVQAGSNSRCLKQLVTKSGDVSRFSQETVRLAGNNSFGDNQAFSSCKIPAVGPGGVSRLRAHRIGVRMTFRRRSLYRACGGVNSHPAEQNRDCQQGKQHDGNAQQLRHSEAPCAPSTQTALSFPEGGFAQVSSATVSRSLFRHLVIV